MAVRVSNSDSDEDQVIQTISSKDKPVIKLRQWLHSFKSNNSQNLKTHIISFLLSQGLYDAASTFSQQANITMPAVDQNIIKQRYEIKSLIRKGQIDQALNKIKIIDTNFEKGEQNSQLVFLLKSLKVIHLIKQGNIEESIETAKKELLPFTKKGERFVKEIEKIMGLLAFMNLKECPNKDLIKQEYSSMIASKINRHLVYTREEQNDQSLQALLKLGKWCEKRLSQFISFPNINLESDIELFKQPS